MFALCIYYNTKLNKISKYIAIGLYTFSICYWHPKCGHSKYFEQLSKSADEEV